MLIVRGVGLGCCAFICRPASKVFLIYRYLISSLLFLYFFIAFIVNDVLWCVACAIIFKRWPQFRQQQVIVDSLSWCQLCCSSCCQLSIWTNDHDVQSWAYLSELTSSNPQINNWRKYTYLYTLQLCSIKIPKIVKKTNCYLHLAIDICVISTDYMI